VPAQSAALDLLREAYSRWASGVCIVTTCDAHGEPIGVTATSFTPVSMDPPLVLWCLDESAYSLSAFLEAERFVVHLLGEHQAETSTQFATAGSDKFAYRLRATDDVGTPRLRHCLVQLTCERDRAIPAGDHWILIGRIVDVRYTDGKPLLYFRRKYGVYELHADHDVPSVDAWL
jgi:flavin reductase (DIM6/NTAB) family NADH-FMN oxidoreductase RutF